MPSPRSPMDVEAELHRIKRLQAERRELQLQNKSLSESEAVLRGETAVAKAAALRAEAARDKLFEKLTGCTKQLMSARAALSKKDDPKMRGKSVSEQMKHLAKEKHEVVAIITTLLHEVDSASPPPTAVPDTGEERESVAVADLQKQIAELKAKVEEAEERNAKQQSEWAQRLEELSEHHQRVSEQREATVADLREHNAQLESFNSTIRRDREELLKEKEALVLQVRAAEKKAEAMADQYKKTKEDVAVLEQEVKDLHRKLNDKTTAASAAACDTAPPRESAAVPIPSPVELGGSDGPSPRPRSQSLAAWSDITHSSADHRPDGGYAHSSRQAARTDLPHTAEADLMALEEETAEISERWLGQIPAAPQAKASLSAPTSDPLTRIPAAPQAKASLSAPTSDPLTRMPAAPLTKASVSASDSLTRIPKFSSLCPQQPAFSAGSATPAACLSTLSYLKGKYG